MMFCSLSLRRELSQARLVAANAFDDNGLGELTTRAVRKMIEYVAVALLKKIFEFVEGLPTKIISRFNAIRIAAMSRVIAACEIADPYSRGLYNAESLQSIITSDFCKPKGRTVIGRH